MKCLTVIGARPQFIKAATISRVFNSIQDWQEVIVHTGQHYDENMSGVFFEELEIPQPDYHLNVGSGNHGSQTGRMLEKIEEVLISEKPDIVLVFGDTNSTLAGALAAVKLHIPLAHVEAGLRSFNRKMPEEINRILTDCTSDILFPPTKNAVEHLINEGIAEDKIYLVGDVMYDAALFFSQRADRKSEIIKYLNLQPNQYILATVHRAENTDDPERLKSIFKSLSLINRDIKVILPLHPRTKSALDKCDLLNEIQEEIQVIEPVGYLEMVLLEKNSRLIITDSGGVQKEAFFHRIPCVTLREETEWIELIKAGWNTLVSPNHDPQTIYSIILNLLHQDEREIVNLYGEGNSAEKIVNIIQSASF